MFTPRTVFTTCHVAAAAGWLDAAGRRGAAAPVDAPAPPAVTSAAALVAAVRASNALIFISCLP
jgi:hypothetical protein